MNNTDRHYINCAKEVAKLSDFKTKTGCVIVYNHTIISSGCNTHKTHPIQFKYNDYRFDKRYNTSCVIPKAHAEMIALSKIKYLDINWSKVKVYVYRIFNRNGFGLARPCPACMQFIKELGIKHIFYTTYDGVAEEVVVKDLI